jgi:hypothetical protein
MGLAERIFETDDLEVRHIDVPEWDVKLELRSPSAEERSRMVQSFISMDDLASGSVRMNDLSAMYPALLIACCYDPETGEPVFQSDPATVAAINRKRGEVVERVAMVCMELCGLKPDSVEAAKADSSTSPG